MGIYGVETWEEVLALFEQDGAFEGRWGWLGVLQRAHIGSAVEVLGFAEATYAYLGDHAYWAGWGGYFTESPDGQILLQTLEGGFLGWGPMHDQARGELHSANEPGSYGAGYRLHLGLGGPSGLGVEDRGVFWSNKIYPVTKVNTSGVDWVGVGLDLGSIAADFLPGAQGFGTALDVTAVSLSWSDFSLALATGAPLREVVYSGGSLFLDVVSLAPGFGAPGDIASLILNFGWNTRVYVGP